MKTLQRNLNIFGTYVLAGILVGTLAYQFFKNHAPCPLCLLQRLCILGIAVGPLLNLRFGIKAAHYAWSLIASCLGSFIALVQIALHACPDTRVFGSPLFGYELYTWSFFAFSGSIILHSLMLLIYKEEPANASLTRVEKGAFIAIFLTLIGNLLTIFL